MRGKVGIKLIHKGGGPKHDRCCLKDDSYVEDAKEMLNIELVLNIKAPNSPSHSHVPKSDPWIPKYQACQSKEP